MSLTSLSVSPLWLGSLMFVNVHFKHVRWQSSLFVGFGFAHACSRSFVMPRIGFTQSKLFRTVPVSLVRALPQYIERLHTENPSSELSYNAKTSRSLDFVRTSQRRF